MAKRMYRNDMPQQQKDKIAAANTGKKTPQIVRDKISRSLQQYWQNLPYKPTNNGGTSGSTGAIDNPFKQE